MSIRGATPASVTGPFIAAAVALGLRPPVRLVDQGVRAWALASEGEQLFVDEYGDLWWGRIEHPGSARVVRPIWPEEFARRAPDIERELTRILTL